MQLGCGDPAARQGQEHGREYIWLGGKTYCSSMSMLPELGTITPFPVLAKTLLTWEPMGQQLKTSGSV